MALATRRSALAILVSALAAVASRARAATSLDRDFIAAAFRMKDEAVRSGDEPYGAVVVKDGRIIGFGPSRVVLRADWTAHAEREAVRHAQAHLGKADLSGCMMYSTSRPCAACECAAAEAKVARMYVGLDGMDAGAPRS